MLKTDFDGSDNEAYSEEEEDLREDFSLSSDEESRRDREFFGDDEYTMLTSEKDEMSMTKIEREKTERKARVTLLKRDVD